MRSIEQHSANISNEMGAMFGGRIEDIQENSASQAAKELVSSTQGRYFEYLLMLNSDGISKQSDNRPAHLNTIAILFCYFAHTNHAHKRRRWQMNLARYPGSLLYNV